MEPFDVTQLLELAIFGYALGREVKDPRPGEDLRTLVDKAEVALKDHMRAERARMGDLVSEQMSFSDWFAVYDALRADAQLSALTLDAFSLDTRGARLSCLSDDAGNAVLALGGTGPGEWEDDCTAAYVADSDQQLAALAWVRREVLPRGYAHLVACGHSKGGNKAQYLVIRTQGAVERAVSFDGEGFSRQFLWRYANDIAAHAGRLASYALDCDFVNGLLNPIVNPEHRHYLHADHVADSFGGHAPSALFAPRKEGERRLTLAPEVESAGQAGTMATSLTDYLQIRLSHDELVTFCTVLGDALRISLSSALSDEERRAQLAELWKSPDFPFVASTMLDFFRSTGQQVNIGDVLRIVAPGTAPANAVADLTRRLNEK